MAERRKIVWESTWYRVVGVWSRDDESPGAPWTYSVIAETNAGTDALGAPQWQMAGERDALNAFAHDRGEEPLEGYVSLAQGVDRANPPADAVDPFDRGQGGGPPG